MTVGIFTDTYYPELNGVANSAYQLKIGLEKMGHKVYVFTVTNPEVKEKEENIFRIRSMPFIFMDERKWVFNPKSISFWDLSFKF